MHISLLCRCWCACYPGHSECMLLCCAALVCLHMDFFFSTPPPPSTLLIAAFSFGACALTCLRFCPHCWFCFPALLFLSLVPLLLASHLEIHVGVKLHQLLDAAVSPPPMCDCLKVFTALSYFSSKIMVAKFFFFWCSPDLPAHWTPFLAMLLSFCDHLTLTAIQNMHQ